MRRRRFVTAMGGGVVLAACGTKPKEGVSGNTPAQSVPERRLENFGLQLSTITPMLMADFEGTLEKVAQIGYRQVEFSALGFLGRPVATVARLLQANGLQAPVGRISPRLPAEFSQMPRAEQMAAFRKHGGPDYLLENIRHALEDADALGQHHLVLPALMPDNFATLDHVQRSLDLLRQGGELCARAGVQFGYHNHDWELQAVEGEVPYDMMLAQIDPQLLAYQMDVYWITKGGRDPLDYLARFPGRFPTMHLKDITADGDFEDVGYGEIDFPAVASAALEAGTEYFFVERDSPPDPMSTAQRAYDYLNTMTF